MYDVLYINRTQRSTVAGSEPMDRHSVVLIVESERAAA